MRRRNIGESIGRRRREWTVCTDERITDMARNNLPRGLWGSWKMTGLLPGINTFKSLQKTKKKTKIKKNKNKKENKKK